MAGVKGGSVGEQCGGLVGFTYGSQPELISVSRNDGLHFSSLVWIMPTHMGTDMIESSRAGEHGVMPSNALV